MVTLVPYTDADFEAMNRYFPQKEIHKYTNRGVRSTLIIRHLQVVFHVIEGERYDSWLWGYPSEVQS